MITSDGQLTTRIEFGKNGIGSIGMIGKREGIMTLQQLVAEIKIGESFDMKKDISKLPEVVLVFNNTDSIDSMIRVLEKVKHLMEHDPLQFAMAC